MYTFQCGVAFFIYVIVSAEEEEEIKNKTREEAARKAAEEANKTTTAHTTLSKILSTLMARVNKSHDNEDLTEDEEGYVHTTTTVKSNIYKMLFCSSD